jgi:hypothetical protein
MSTKTSSKIVIEAPTNDNLGHALRFLVGAIKANLLGMFYDYDEHKFLTFDEVSKIDTERIITAPKTRLAEVNNSASKVKTYAIWCQCVFNPRNINGGSNMSILKTLELLSGILNKNYTDEQKEEAKKLINPAFYLSAILIVLRQLNTQDASNHFRNEYLRLHEMSEDTHFVYRFMDEFVILKTTMSNVVFDIITGKEARELHDVECYTKILTETKSIKDPVERSTEVRKLASERRCAFYLELKKRNDITSELADLNQNQFIFTNNWLSAHNMQRTMNQTLTHLMDKFFIRSNIILPLHKDNRNDIPKIPPFQAGASNSSSIPSSTKKPASDEPKPKEPKAKVKMPAKNTGQHMSVEKEKEERDKKRFADTASGNIVDQLLLSIVTSQGKVKILQSLNVAAGLPGKATKCGGTVFNLNSTRLVKADNNNTGIVVGTVDGAPLFKGRKVQLAVNVKSEVFRNNWLKTSAIATNLNLTSGNEDLVSWVRNQVMPKVWEKFSQAFLEDASALHEEQEGDDEDDEETRIDNVSATEQDENTEPENLFGKKRNFASEMDFISAHAAMLPVVTYEDDLSKLGGNLDAQRANRLNVNKVSMGLDQEELKRLEVVRKRVPDLFKSDSQSVIAAIRNNIKAKLGVPVGTNGLPFQMEMPEKAEEYQFTADYRSGVAGNFSSFDFEGNDDEEDEA